MMENTHKTESIAKKSVEMGMEESRRLLRRGLAMCEKWNEVGHLEEKGWMVLQ